MRELSQEEVDQVGAGPGLPNPVPPFPTITSAVLSSLFPAAPLACSAPFILPVVIEGTLA